MGLAQDIIDDQEQLGIVRLPWETVWNDTIKYALPVGEKGFGAYDPVSMKSTVPTDLTSPQAEKRGREIYDGTSVWAVDRLTSGIESLVTPQSDKWHGLGKNDPLAGKNTDEEGEWFELLRDYLFSVRYDPRSGFVIANQASIRASIALGTGVFMIQEGFGDRGVPQEALPFNYRYVPLAECYLALDTKGNYDTNSRRFFKTARQLAQEAEIRGWQIGQKTIDKANDASRRTEMVEVIHHVAPRRERGGSGSTTRDSDWMSVYVDVEDKIIMNDDGFFEFPYVVDVWQRSGDAAYGESALMMAMAEIKSLNLLAKHAMRAAQQHTRPPIATTNDGAMNRPNLNPGANNPGALTPDGKMLIQPIITSQPGSFIQDVLEVQRQSVRETLFINLFQILVQNPGMTATEALLRANEKGELIGPVGARVQQARAQMLERESGILQRKGAYDEGSPLAPPESLSGKSFGIRWTSPLDRIRRSNEMIGMQAQLEFVGGLAGVDPEIVVRLDTDDQLKRANEILGAGKTGLKSDDEVKEAREKMRQAQQAQQGIELAQGAADAVVKGNEAAQASGVGDLSDVASQLGISIDPGTLVPGGGAPGGGADSSDLDEGTDSDFDLGGLLQEAV